MSAAAATLQYEEPGKVPSVVLAVLVHLLLAMFLIFGVHWQSHEPEAVAVDLWSSLPAPAKVEPVPEVKPVPQVTPAPEPKPEPKAEIKPEPKVEKVVEPKKPDIALEKKKEVKKEEQKKPPPKLKLDLRKDISAQLKRETAAVNQRLEQERLAEQAQREAATVAAATADAAYVARLQGKIKSNVVLPPDIPGNPEAIFDVVQLPDGEVMSVTLRKSSGIQAYDAAVERAIRKSSPLPKPERPDQFRRNLELKFRPLD
ncbi:MAG: energy transducer TonB [Burkholderiales bacterium]